MENQHINESILSEEILEDQKKNRIDHMKYMPGMEDIGSEILDQVVDAMHAYDNGMRQRTTDDPMRREQERTTVVPENQKMSTPVGDGSSWDREVRAAACGNRQKNAGNGSRQCLRGNRFLPLRGGADPGHDRGRPAGGMGSLLCGFRLLPGTSEKNVKKV